MAERRKISRTLREEMDDLRSRGVALPKNPERAQTAAVEYKQLIENSEQLRKDFSSFGRQSTISSSQEIRHLHENAELIRAMGRHRTAGMRKHGMASDVSMAIPRFTDPLEYWDLSGLPWNMADEGHRHKLHKWLRLFKATHYLVPILIDTFARFPLVGMRVSHHDRAIEGFYEEQFLDRLNYEGVLTSIGTEKFTVGEAFTLGSFNESLGVWEREELLMPEDIIIENLPLLGTKMMKIRPTEELRRLANTKNPAAEYKQLATTFPDLIPYLQRGEPFPVSDVMLKQVALKQNDWDDRGTPHMLRILRTLIHEEKLMASQDAIAERLYSPLILAKLGINELGGNMGPMIPDPAQLDSFRDDMDIALSSDFRLMVYHYALEIQNVFGREQVPDLGNDFDRIERRICQGFGVNPGFFNGGGGSQAYASSALQWEYTTQILRTHQNDLQRHFKERAEIVAEAQGHFDYERRGQTRVPIMEEVVEFDDEGRPYIVERHKLMTPELQFAPFNLRDEATERQFLQSLRGQGVPVSDQNLMVNVPFEFDDTLDELNDELIQKTVKQQQGKLTAYKILTQRGLPIPPGLKAEIEGGGDPGMEGAGGPPGGGAPPDMGGIGAPPTMGPGVGDMGDMGIVMPPPPEDLGGMGPTKPGPAGNTPEISNEKPPGAAVHSSSVSIEDIDRRIASAQEELDLIEHRKRLRKMGVRTEKQEELEWDMRRESRVVIDRVPPAVREQIENA